MLIQKRSRVNKLNDERNENEAFAIFFSTVEKERFFFSYFSLGRGEGVEGDVWIYISVGEFNCALLISIQQICYIQRMGSKLYCVFYALHSFSFLSIFFFGNTFNTLAIVNTTLILAWPKWTYMVIQLITRWNKIGFSKKLNWFWVVPFENGVFLSKFVVWLLQSFSGQLERDVLSSGNAIIFYVSSMFLWIIYIVTFSSA